MNGPVISIIGTIFNQAVHAERVLDVWCRQHFAYPYEILVLDDGSTDGTREMVEEVMRRFPGLIRYFYFDATHFTRNCTLLFNTAIRRLMRSDIAVLQWYDRIPGSLHALTRLYEPHRHADDLVVSFLTRHIGTSSSKDVLSPRQLDRLLATVPWRERPETLAAIMGKPGRHCDASTMNESACFSVRREHLLRLNGYDERYFKVANYSNIELYGRLAHLGLTFRILDECTFHQPHPSARDDVQTLIEPESVVVRNTRIRQDWGSILPADHVDADRVRWTIVRPPAAETPRWVHTASSDAEVLTTQDPNDGLRRARGRMICYTSRSDADLLPHLAAIEERTRAPACGCVAELSGGRVIDDQGTASVSVNLAFTGAVHGPTFCVPRRAAIANGLAFDTTLDPMLAQVDFSRQMIVWGGGRNVPLTARGSSSTWQSNAFLRRWDFLRLTDPPVARRQAAMGDVLARQKRYAAAMIRYQRAIKAARTDGTLAMCQVQVAKMHYALGNIAAAERGLRDCLGSAELAEAPSQYRTSALFYLGEIARRLGRLDQARECFAAALAIDPSHRTAAQRLTELGHASAAPAGRS